MQGKRVSEKYGLCENGGHDDWDKREKSHRRFSVAKNHGNYSSLSSGITVTLYKAELLVHTRSGKNA